MTNRQPSAQAMNLLAASRQKEATVGLPTKFAEIFAPHPVSKTQRFIEGSYARKGRDVYRVLRLNNDLPVLKRFGRIIGEPGNFQFKFATESKAMYPISIGERDAVNYQSVKRGAWWKGAVAVSAQVGKALLTKGV